MANDAIRIATGPNGETLKNLTGKTIVFYQPLCDPPEPLAICWADEPAISRLVIEHEWTDEASEGGDTY